jgi:hypothetical protein
VLLTTTVPGCTCTLPASTLAGTTGGHDRCSAGPPHFQPLLTVVGRLLLLLLPPLAPVSQAHCCYWSPRSLLLLEPPLGPSPCKEAMWLRSIRPPRALLDSQLHPPSRGLTGRPRWQPTEGLK